jgi:hypothetical protein
LGEAIKELEEILESIENVNKWKIKRNTARFCTKF